MACIDERQLASVLGSAIGAWVAWRAASPPAGGGDQKPAGKAAPKQVRVGVACWLVDPLRQTALVGVRVGSHGDGTFHSPGGHVEMGESLEDTFSRELREETGIHVSPRNVRHLATTNVAASCWLASRFALAARSAIHTAHETDKCWDFCFRKSCCGASLPSQFALAAMLSSPFRSH